MYTLGAHFYFDSKKFELIERMVLMYAFTIHKFGFMHLRNFTIIHPVENDIDQ